MTNTKIALVTGANKGIGKEIARQLAGLGMTVLLGARDTERGEKAAAELRADGTDVRFLRLDVTDDASVAAAAGAIDSTYGRLDVLVNNAGILIDRGTRPSEIPAETVRDTYETNVFGVVRSTRARLPLVRRAEAAPILTDSSAPASLDGRDWGRWLLAYTSSKTALNALTVQYARELHPDGILVNAADPGYCATDLNDHTGTDSPTDGARIAVHLATLPAGGPTGTFTNSAGTVPW